MAPKDYVAREPAPAKKTVPKKTTRQRNTKKTEPPKAATPWLRIIFTLMVVLGVAVFLWSIKDGTGTDSPVTVAQPKAKTQDEDALPEKPEEEWEFMTTLTDPNYEVEVELPAETEASTKEYILQCGSFKTMAQAESMRARIAFQGLESSIRESNGSNGRWFRVVLGPYERKRLAEKDRHTLQRAKFTNCRIW